MSVFPPDEDMEFLTLAVEPALRSVDSGGGPFGAVVARDGIVLGMGTNEVTRSLDPTGHAEIVASGPRAGAWRVRISRNACCTPTANRARCA